MAIMLKLAALDEEDLAVISLHLYNARLNPAEIIWQKREKRFLAPLRRFDWEMALAGAVAELSPRLEKQFAELCAAAGEELPAGWQTAAAGKGGADKAKGTAEAERAAKAEAAEIPREIAAILHFDAVRTVRSFGVDLEQKQRLLTLRHLRFSKGPIPPAGTVEFVFYENAGIRLETDCIEGRLTDLPEDSAGEE